MLKIINNLLVVIGLLFGSAFAILFSSAILSLIAFVLIWLGDAGYWFLNFSVPVRCISSIIIVGCYLIGSNRHGGWKKIFKTIMDSKEEWK